MAKAQYAKSAAQLDLEARQKEDYVPSTVVNQGTEPEQSTNGYVGVGLEYQTYANETESPVKADKGPEAKVFENFVADDADFDKAGTPEGEGDVEDDSTAPPSGSTTTTPPTGTTPPAK